MPTLRDLPSVDQLLQSPLANEFLTSFGRPLVIDAIRQVLDDIRVSHKEDLLIPDREAILKSIGILLNGLTSPSLLPVLNATGVILHTNLGRSPLSKAALRAIQETSQGYSNLEFDLDTGRRGSRLIHAEQMLTQITGAEAALAVNNNAAAVLLVLTALAKRRGVIIARSQLIEIGGGFRIPDVMKQSGARLVEVGTTNRIHLTDYENAIQEGSIALVMRAHRSNFQIIGFTSEPSLAEIVQVAHSHGLPLIDDLGSGAMLDTSRFGLGHEPTVGESLSAGADLVCFSGDKLLGGPQAGIIIGRASLVDRLKKHPLARAVRLDKLCLAALSATLLHYLKGEAETHIPIWQMITASPESLRTRAENWMHRLGQGEVIPSLSTVGGGSLPGESLHTFVLSLNLSHPNRFIDQLRTTTPPIIARLDEGRVLFDPRTILPGEDELLISKLHTLLTT